MKFGPASLELDEKNEDVILFFSGYGYIIFVSIFEEKLPLKILF